MTQLPDEYLAALVQLGLSHPSNPYLSLDQLGSKVSAIAGTSIKHIESKVGVAIAHESDLTDYRKALYQRQANRIDLTLTGWDDVTFYGSVVDEILRTERNKLRLSLLSQVVPQEYLVHATIVGPWIPAIVLEDANPPRETLVSIADGFARDLDRALPDHGFEHVGMIGFCELKKCFGRNPDGHDMAMASDWYLRRGSTYWSSPSPIWPQYALHVHLIGFATRFQWYATANEIDAAFGCRFPERWAVRVTSWNEKKSVIDNVIGLGNYVWKIGPHRKRDPITPMPPPDEIRANARFWQAVGHHRRNLDLNGHWPELGVPRLPRSFAGSLTKLDFMRRQLVWDLGQRIWTADDFEPNSSGEDAIAEAGHGVASHGGRHRES